MVHPLTKEQLEIYETYRSEGISAARIKHKKSSSQVRYIVKKKQLIDSSQICNQNLISIPAEDNLGTSFDYFPDELKNLQTKSEEYIEIKKDNIQIQIKLRDFIKVLSV